MNEDNVLNDNEINPEYFEVNNDLENTLDLNEMVEYIKKNGEDNEK